MRSKALIHNDDMMCFHVAAQGIQKVVVMSRHNFKDEAYKRWWASQNNECDGKEAQGKKQRNH
jgi:hypothetical protein